jgi:CheY-like chemotaxis protein
MAKQLGDILVNAAIISPKTLERALERQKKQGLRLGQVLEEMGVITEQELIEALEKQQSPFSDSGCKRKLGDLLVESRLISETTLERALAKGKSEGKRLGQVLEEMGVITEQELVDALGRQFNFKTISGIASHIYPKDLLVLFPVEFAMKRLVFPLKRKDMMLAVAITDPFDSETTELLTRITGLQVVPVIASRREILDAISKHYLHVTVNPEAGEMILVVEDSLTISTVIQAALVKEGFRVMLAKDGLEALKEAFTHRPSLVITDAQMPRMDGYGLLRAMKANPMTADVPVIMMTGKASTEEERAALEAGFIDFIPKPVQPMRICSRVKRALEIARKMKNCQ